MTKTKSKRGAHLTRAHQKRARAKVKRESLVAAGKRGAEVTAERYGYEQLFLAWQRKKLLNPSQWELNVIGLLARLGFMPPAYEREARLGTSLRTVDFLFPTLNAAIEVRGEIHHKPDAPNKAVRDASWIKKLELLESLKIKLLIVEYWELKDGKIIPTIEKIKRFLEGKL